MKKKYLNELRRITESIPKDLLMNLTKMEKQSPTMKKLLEIALTKPDSEVSPKQKRRFKAILDSGYLDREVEVINKPVEQQIDDYMTAEIALAVEEGRLPKQAPMLKLKNNKGKQYARRQQARLKALFNGSDQDVAHGPKDDQANEEEHSARQNDGGLLSQPGSDTGEQGAAR